MPRLASPQRNVADARDTAIAHLPVRKLSVLVLRRDMVLQAQGVVAGRHGVITPIGLVAAGGGAAQDHAGANGQADNGAESLPCCCRFSRNKIRAAES